MFKAELNDPYKEFIVEYFENLQPHQHGKAGISMDFQLACMRVMLFIQILEHHYWIWFSMRSFQFSSSF